MEGRCICGEVAYRLTERPLFVHCCHCSWCQRESGSAFALNALIETDRIELLAGRPEAVAVPSHSGKGQEILRCPRCRVALWSHYAGAGPLMAFVRVGTLAEPASCPPDIHIYTTTKLPWVRLDEGVPAMAEYYARSKHWPEPSLARWQILRASMSG
ncbi:GFA family protein [Cereibacter johrii]|uniref:GFA family protein n=1 Tax=Cereibacter johrii TaxID=445629 RepID=UPI000DCD47D8|nr:GFA family protein [Cereibacter johrii]RAZ87586.1 aldehyde-activating protein [Cereibacter johrii]